MNKNNKKEGNVVIYVQYSSQMNVGDKIYLETLNKMNNQLCYA